jgi:orotate phosphoribosyltransferase
MIGTEKNIGNYLLQSKAIKLEPANPFTWASGWKSPIYCDNRITLSFPEIRNAIKDAFTHLVTNKFLGIDTIAGVATGAIAHGVLVAEALNLPFAYVRSKPKGHGLENMIEGKVESGTKIVVIEDLISTGNSSLNAVKALRAAGCEVLGMAAIFSYGFETATENFKNADCKLFTLTNYNALINLAAETGYIKEEDITLLNKWRMDPANWGK